MEKLLKIFIIVLTSLAVFLLLFATVESAMVQTQTSILTITNKQAIGGKTLYKTQYVGKIPMQVPYYQPSELRISAKLKTGENATFDVSPENDAKAVIGESYLCRLYFTRLTRTPKITEIYFNE